MFSSKWGVTLLSLSCLFLSFLTPPPSSPHTHTHTQRAEVTSKEIQTLKPPFFKCCGGVLGPFFFHWVHTRDERYRVLCVDLSLLGSALAGAFDRGSDSAEKPHRSVLWSRRHIFLVSMPENRDLTVKKNRLPSSLVSISPLLIYRYSSLPL